MKKRFLIMIAVLATLAVLAGCSRVSAGDTKASNETVIVETETVAGETVVEDISVDEADTTTETEDSLELEDGMYLVKFDTDSSMFHVNEMMDGKALLTVENGTGNLHLIMPSKNVLNLYRGLASDAENNPNDWITPCIEEVTYDDGLTEEVFAFDVPVDVLGEEFDLALIGKKDVWYDHKVSISEPEEVKVDETEDTSIKEKPVTEGTDGTIEVSLEGGTGKAKLISPTAIRTSEEGYLVMVEWSSKYYDYMIVDGEKYLPAEVNEHSVYEILVKDIREPLKVIADTVAMSEPHEIEYTITFDVNSMK